MPLSGRAVNAAATLYDVPAKDIWQHLVFSADHVELGRAVGQIIEPAAWAVRYIIILDAQARRCLLPATLVSGAEDGFITTSLQSTHAGKFVEYKEPLERSAEEIIHTALGCVPYWLERTKTQ